MEFEEIINSKDKRFYYPNYVISGLEKVLKIKEFKTYRVFDASTNNEYKKVEESTGMTRIRELEENLNTLHNEKKELNKQVRNKEIVLQIREIENTQRKFKKELKELNKKLNLKKKQIKGEFGSRHKIIIENIPLIDGIEKLSELINEITIFSNFYKLDKRNLSYCAFLCLTNLKLSEKIIFGRVAEKVKHGGGLYLFSPLEEEIIPDILKKEENKILDSWKLHELLLNLTLDSKIQGLMMRNQSINANYSVINQLNKNEFLIKSLSKIKTLGNHIHHDGISAFSWDTIYKFKTQVDISLIIIPFMNYTLIFIKQYIDSMNDLTSIDSFKGLFTLIMELNNILKNND